MRGWFEDLDGFTQSATTVERKKKFCWAWYSKIGGVAEGCTSQETFEKLNYSIKKLPYTDRGVLLPLHLSQKGIPTIRIFGSVLEEIRRFCNEDLELWTEFLVYPSGQPHHPKKLQVRTTPGKCVPVVDKTVIEEVDKFIDIWGVPPCLGTSYYEFKDNSFCNLQFYYNVDRVTLDNISIWFSSVPRTKSTAPRK